MANQTVTTTVNYDAAAISGLLNGETITINGGSVTVDSDVRWNQQAAVFGDVTLSSDLNSRFIFDASSVWEVPFSASSGNVPTQDILGSNSVTGGTSGATGELTRVWATGSLEPAAAGGAMPATGWIKLRSKTGNFQSGETITLPGGATITASGAGKRSWIHIVGRSERILTVPSLARWQTNGDWYELGMTDGNDDQTFQFPVSDMTPAIWVETAPGSDQYDIWLNAASFWTNNGISTDVRGKYFGMVAATGVITIAQRTGLTAGYKPPSGCRVRVPNIILSIAYSTDYSTNVAQTNPPQSYRMSIVGRSTLNNLASNWGAQLGGEISIQNCGWSNHGPVISSKNEVVISNTGFGLISNQQNGGLSISSFAGVTLTDVIFSRPGASTNTLTVIGSQNVSLTRVTTNTPLSGVSASLVGILLSYCTTVTLTNCRGVYGHVRVQGSKDVTITNYSYAGRQVGDSTSSDGNSAIVCDSGTSDVFIEGYSNFENLPNVSPSTALVNVADTSDCEVRNIGTQATPVDLNGKTRHIISTTRSLRIVARRTYVTNNSLQVFATNTSNDFQIYNMWGLNSTSRPVLGSDNMIVRGIVGWFELQEVAAQGSHWGDAVSSANLTSGRIYLFATAPTEASADQCTASLGASSSFASANPSFIIMASTSDVVTYTMPYHALGVTGFSSAPVITTTNPGNFTFDFQYDIVDGNGFSAWQTLNQANLSAITVDPAKGIKLKVRISVNTANSTNKFSGLYIPFDTDAVNQQIQYPLPTTQNVGFVTNILAGSRLQIYNVTTATEIANEVVSGTSFTYPYDEGTDFTDGDLIRVRLARCTGATASIGFEGFAVANANGWSLFAAQDDDVVYNANGIDGTAVTEFTFDYPNIQVDIDDSDGTTSIMRLYAWWASERTTADGIRTLIGGLIAEDAANYKIITSRVDLKLDNTASTGVIFAGDLRLYRDDGQAPVVNSTSGGGSITLYAGKVYTSVVSTSSPVITGDISQVPAAVQSGLTSQGYTAARSGNLDRLDAAVSTRLAATSQATLDAIKTNTDLIPGTL